MHNFQGFLHFEWFYLYINRLLVISLLLNHLIAIVTYYLIFYPNLTALKQHTNTQWESIMQTSSSLYIQNYIQLLHNNIERLHISN